MLKAESDFFGNQKLQTKTRDELMTELENARKEQEIAMAAAAQRKHKFEETDLHKQVQLLYYQLFLIKTQTSRKTPS